MRIAISTDGESIESNVDQSFGRCDYFLIFDTEGKNIIKTEVVLNKGAAQGHGAGFRVGEQLGELKVDKLITGDLGPNVTSVLNKIGITAYHASGKAKNAISLFLEDKLEKITDIVEPHSEIREEKVNKAEKVFFPLLDKNGEDSEISEHFGHAPFFGIYDVQKKELDIIKNDLNHTDPTKSPIDQIEDAVHPTTIFAKGIGSRAINIIADKGLLLKTGNYRTVGEAIKNLDKMEDQTRGCEHTP